MSTHNMVLSAKAILMSTHKICFYGEIMKIIPKLFSIIFLIRFTIEEQNDDV